MQGDRDGVDIEPGVSRRDHVAAVVQNLRPCVGDNHRRAADDFGFVLLSQRHGYHLIGRRTPAGWQTLGSAPAGYSANTPHRLVLTIYDGQASIELDDSRTLALTGLPAGSGEIGLLTHGHGSTRFRAARLMALR